MGSARRFVVVLLAISLSTAVGAQEPDPYIRLVRASRADYQSALVLIMQMSGGEISKGVKACVPPACSVREQRAAAMLHADAAEALIPVDIRAARDHVEAGTRLLEEPKGSTFAARWAAYVALILRANGQPVQAMQLTELAMRQHGSQADLSLAQGLILEAATMARVPDLRGALMQPGGLSDISGGVTAAGLKLRDALEQDPAHQFARLRLGWNHVLLGDSRWHGDLEPLVSVTVRETRYLALLARGTAYEADRKLAAAEADYRAARETLPEFQSACLALSYVQRARGHTDASQASSAECLRLREPTGLPDPWRMFQLNMLDHTTLEWLRAEASLE